MRYFGLVFAFIAIVSFSGCSLDFLKDDSGDGSKISVGTIDYYMPDGVSAVKSLEEDRGVVIEAGDGQEVSGFIATAPQTFAAPAFQGGSLTKSSALTTVDTVISNLGNMTAVLSVNVLTKQVFATPIEAAIVDMEVKTSASYSSMEIVEMMLSDILGLKDTYELSDKNAVKDTSFRVLFAVVNLDGTYYYLATVVPDSAYSQYGGVATLVVSASNFIPEGAKINSATDEFTAVAGSNRADFLFVVDDSGSMSDEQSALSAVASDFKTAVTNAGLTDFSIAIISTGYGIDTLAGSANQVLNSQGLITDMTVFENSVVLGTGGSGTETGIYNSEYSLGANGILVNNFTFPRANTSLSVIILSDEQSQYTSRSGGTTFDVTSNLFVTNGYVVHALVNLGYSGQYEDLASATGGLSANINSGGVDTPDYSNIMDLITIQAGGASSAFKLTQQNVFVSKIEVKMDGTVVPASTTDGWTFNQGSNTIAFFGKYRPVGGEKITITYEYQE